MQLRYESAPWVWCCRFEGQVLQIAPGQMQAPEARAMVDIAQHRDGRLQLSHWGQALRIPQSLTPEQRHSACLETSLLGTKGDISTLG